MKQKEPIYNVKGANSLRFFLLQELLYQGMKIRDLKETSDKIFRIITDTSWW